MKVSAVVPDLDIIIKPIFLYHKKVEYFHYQNYLDQHYHKKKNYFLFFLN